MALGSIALAPYVDWVGRRRMMMFCLIIISIGMLLSAFTLSVYPLAVIRGVTGIGIGIGIGGMLAGIIKIEAL